MGSNGNRRRSSRAARFPFWGSLFDKKGDSEEYLSGSFYGTTEEEEERSSAAASLLRELWHGFSIWSCLATLLFLSFTGVLIFLVAQMWTPQNLNDISGYTDKGSAKDLEAQLRNANGAPLSFTEGDINRYLRDTCRMRQTGILSIIARGQGLALRIHNGYVELIIDRLIGANLHQTTAVNLTITQEFDHGRPTLKIDFRGHHPLLGTAPCGGIIGHLKVPPRYIKTLQPALETLLSCYPNITDIIRERGYKPLFIEGKGGEESYVQLIPYAPQI